MLLKMLHRLRVWYYRRGHRPRPASLLFSPSLAFRYAMSDAMKTYMEMDAEAVRKLYATDPEQPRETPKEKDE